MAILFFDQYYNNQIHFIKINGLCTYSQIYKSQNLIIIYYPPRPIDHSKLQREADVVKLTISLLRERFPGGSNVLLSSRLFSRPTYTKAMSAIKNVFDEKHSPESMVKTKLQASRNFKHVSSGTNHNITCLLNHVTYFSLYSLQIL